MRIKRWKWLPEPVLAGADSLSRLTLGLAAAFSVVAFAEFAAPACLAKLDLKPKKKNRQASKATDPINNLLLDDMIAPSENAARYILPYKQFAAQ